MVRGKLTISIDLELAWGVWDIITRDDIVMAETHERPICAALIELFDRYDVPVTWAMVAALLDRSSAASRPGNEACWYAPDIVERIIKAKAAHEIGSHSGRHIYFDASTAEQAENDIAFARQVHLSNGFAFRSFVFPRARLGHFDLLAQNGIRIYRGSDDSWREIARRAGQGAKRFANFIDKSLPIPPRPVVPMQFGPLIHVPGSMQMLGRNGLRRFIMPQMTRAKLYLGLERARRAAATFHLWFHPSNFYYRRNEQLGVLAWFLERAAKEANRGHIEICTMGSYAKISDELGIAKATEA